MQSYQSYIEQKLLPYVTKPTRYAGNEWNVKRKEWDLCRVRTVFCFPDVYEVGMSHLGLRILYDIVNKQPGMLMERAFAPWVDMESLLREHQIPLFSLESFRALSDFDVLGFTLQYEMSYTNILNMLDLAGIPVKVKDRQGNYPLVMAGGPCAFNPEPLADFIDVFVIGEGEEVILDVLELVNRLKDDQGNLDKEFFLKEAVKIDGIYVPSLYRVDYRPNGLIKDITPIHKEVPPVVKKRVVKDFDTAPFPTETMVPNIETIHDRIMLEVLRGCSRGCRFCQAGVIYRPVRERDADTLLEQAEQLLKATGYDEIALTSLSTLDYTCVEHVTKELIRRYREKGVGVSLPSLRVDAFSVNLAKEIQQVRKTGLTFAPEAGTQRLRDVINKGVSEEDILDAVTSAFAAGWTGIKLYFMIGLPTETQEDLDGIVDLSRKILQIGRKVKPAEVKKPIQITVSASSFVPKAHTPFQWQGFQELELLRQKQSYLKQELKKLKSVSFKYHDVETSLMEAAFARGGRELGKALETAWRLGCKFDGWSEHFKYHLWREAFEKAGLQPEDIAHRVFELTEILPWSHISTGVSSEWLIEEYRKALTGKATEDCRTGACHTCGVCPELGVSPSIKGGGR